MEGNRSRVAILLPETDSIQEPRQGAVARVALRTLEAVSQHVDATVYSCRSNSVSLGTCKTENYSLPPIPRRVAWAAPRVVRALTVGMIHQRRWTDFDVVEIHNR